MQDSFFFFHPEFFFSHISVVSILLSQYDQPSSKHQKDDTKMTKHSFLSKIKDAASAGNEKSDATLEKDDRDTDNETKQTSKWDALKDDYLLDPKKVRMNQFLKYYF